MFCTQCRTELPEHAQYCLNCGAAQLDSAFKETHPLRIVVWLLAAIIGVFIVAVTVAQRHPSFFPHTTNAQTMPQPHEMPIAQTAFTVGERSSRYVKFDVPANSTDVWLDGHFQASGGSGNDIEVYLYDQDGFVNLQNRHEPMAYFSSGRLTEGKISATLPSQAGTYYLVFSNKFSLISPKAVQLSAVLHYTN